MSGIAGDMIPGAVQGGSWGDLANVFPGFQWNDVDEFRKAVVAGYGTDVATLTGGGALRLQSLEPTLLKTLQTNEDFTIFNMLEKSAATATVDEYTVKDRIGGYPGSAFSAELDTIPEDQGTYDRKVGLVKYLMTMRRVSAVQRSQKTLVDTMADQAVDATLELLTSTEWGIIYGDSACSTVEFDGIVKQMLALGGDHVLDLRGNSPAAAAREFIDSQAFIRGYGNFGRLTDFFVSNDMQVDMDQKLDPQHRVMLTGENNQSIQYGTPVRGVRTSWGPIMSHPDIFITEGQPPFEARGGNFAVNVTSAVCAAPDAVTATANAAPQTGSLWATDHAGLYYYGVEGSNARGRSATVKSTQVAVAAGGSVTVAIDESGSGAGNETCYWIHRSRKNGTNASADLREMIRVPKTGSGTTTFVDLNARIPGTSVIPLLSMQAGQKAITMRRLLPMTRFALYPTNQAVYPWAQLLFLYLRMGKIRWHRLMVNALPSGARWRPFN